MEISSVQALPESLEGIRKRMDKKMSFWFESRYPRYKYSQLGNIRLWFEARKMFLSGWGLIHKSSSASCFNVGLMMIEKLLQNHDFVENGGQVEEEARWLYNVFIDQSTGQLVVPQNASEALTAFMKFIESHDSMSRKRSLCYAGIISHNRELIQQSANMGYELAHAWIQEHYSLEEVFMAASHVCSILEPFCIRCNLQTIRPGVAFANDEQYYFISKLAVEIGECVGYYWFGRLYHSTSEPERYHWFGLHAHITYSPILFKYADEEIVKEMVRHVSENTNPRVLYKVGEMMKGHVQFKTSRLFGVTMPRDVLDSARRVVCIYDEICRRTREAIRCWEIIAKRRGFHKDIYPIVSAILWERRVDADYYLEPIRRGPDRAAKRRKE